MTKKEEEMASSESNHITWSDSNDELYRRSAASLLLHSRAAERIRRETTEGGARMLAAGRPELASELRRWGQPRPDCREWVNCSLRSSKTDKSALQGNDDGEVPRGAQA